VELDTFRSRFPVLERISWLSTPSCAPASTPVMQAVADELEQWNAGVVSWVDRDQSAERSRESIAGLLGVQSSEVALLPSLSESAATVSWSLPEGSRIVVGAQEYRSNSYPWLAAERRGMTVHQVPMPDGLLSSEALVEAITDDTTLVAVSAVQSASGSRTDLVPVAERCRAVGARLFVDATQSTGVLRLPEGIDPDFVAMHGYKWLLGIRGAAWLYVRSDRLPELDPLAPTITSTDNTWTDYYGGPLDYSSTARKLDASRTWPTWAGAAASVELVTSLDQDQLERHCLRLADLLRQGAVDLGLRVLPTELPSHILTIAIDDVDHAVRELGTAGVQATARAGGLRFGFHGFNTTDDVDRTLGALQRLSPSDVSR
jgi:selenocysteine lyase/cysteine desulfurase